MLNYQGYEYAVPHHEFQPCPFHERQPAGQHPNCTCSSTHGMRPASPEEVRDLRARRIAGIDEQIAALRAERAWLKARLDG